jgi:hypothetical protein
MREKKWKQKLWNEADEKMNWGAVARIYRVFPTDSPTTNLNNIIFNYFVGDVSKIRQ